MEEHIRIYDEDSDPMLSPGYYQEGAALRIMRNEPIPTATSTLYHEGNKRYYLVYVYGRGYAVTNWYGKLLHFTLIQSKASRWTRKGRAERWMKKHGYIL